MNSVQKLVATLKARFASGEGRFRSYVGLLSIDFLAKGLSFLLLPVYLHLMPQSEYGVFCYFQSIITSASLILSMGLYVSLTKIWMESNTFDEKQAAFSTVNLQLLVLIAGFLVLSIFFHFDEFLIEILVKNAIDYSALRPFCVGLLVITTCTLFFSNFFFASDEVRRVQEMNITRTMIPHAFGIAILYFSTRTAASRMSGTFVGELLLFLYFSYHYFRNLTTRFSRRIFWKSLVLGIPIGISAIIGIIVNSYDKFSLERSMGFNDLSIYYLAFSFAGILPIFFSSFQNLWLPYFLKAENLQDMWDKTLRVAGLLGFGLSIIGGTIYLLASGCLRYGVIQARYTAMLPILSICLFSQVAAAVSGLYSNFLVKLDITFWVIVVPGFLGACSLVLYPFLITLWGLPGAAAANFCINISFLLIYFVIARSYVFRVRKESA